MDAGADQDSQWRMNPGRIGNTMRFLLIVIAFAIALPAYAREEPDSMGDCALSEDENIFAGLLKQHPQQARETLVCDPRLVEFARSRAFDMAERGYFGHVTPERKGPNALLRATGYEMPKYYVGGFANSIESILGGESNPDKVWRLLTASSVHRSHLLGLDEMYAAQTHYGIAYLHRPDSKFAHYWVVVIAKPGSDDRAMTCTPAPPVCIVH
jgi:uncharacterized protein YkwD